MKTAAILMLCSLAAVCGARELSVNAGAMAKVAADDVTVTTLSKEFLKRAALTAHKKAYGNPNTAPCMADEMKVAIQGLAGSFCSPSCSATSPCPADSWKGATAEGQCVLETPGSASPSQCALICQPEEDDGGCPGTATCQPIQGLGICTYPDPAEEKAADDSA